MYQPSDALTVNQATVALAAGLRAISAGQTAFDLARLTAVDSTAVATLLAWQRAAEAQGATLILSNVPLNLRQLATLYGVADLLHFASPADLSHH